jgi:hypothetical protein
MQAADADSGGPAGVQLAYYSTLTLLVCWSATGRMGVQASRPLVGRRSPPMVAAC